MSNDQGLARIRQILHFSIDISRIKAYYAIVRMEKAKVARDGSRTKQTELKTELLFMYCKRSESLRSAKIFTADRADRADNGNAESSVQSFHP